MHNKTLNHDCKTLVRSATGSQVWNGTLLERLFVYGTLGPGRPNEHVLTSIGRTWKTAAVTERLRDEGWRAQLGYPGIDLDQGGEEIEGFLFSSKNLSNHWVELDDFDGKAYKRVQTKAKLDDGTLFDAYIYAFRYAYETYNPHNPDHY